MSGADDQRDAEDARMVEEALHCAETGNAGHWPTAAGFLAEEVYRLRAELADLMEVAQREMDRLRALNKSLRAELDGTEVPTDVARRWLAERDEARKLLAETRAAGDELAAAAVLATVLPRNIEQDEMVKRDGGLKAALATWRSVRGDAPTQPPADDTAAPDVQVWQSDDGDWGWACAGCDYRSVAWWSDRAVAERAAVEHGCDHCRAAGGSAPASTDGDQ